MSDHNDELAWYPHAQGRNADLLPRGRLALAAGACSLALLTALLAPGAAAARSARQSMREWQALSARSQRASTTRVALEGVTAALADVARFDSARHDATLLLADLARALPDGSALVTLRLTAQGGHIVALSARASHVIAALEKVSGIESPEIVGPVTRESVGGRQVERTTIRFRLGGSTPRREEKSS